MKTSDERIKSINNKVKTKRKERALAWGASVTACILLVFVVVCSLPILGEGVPNITAYKNDEYYPLIEKINAQYKSNKHSVFEQLANQIGGIKNDFVEAPGDSAVSPDNKYEETTLNQVDGVIEGDLLKRSGTHAFYLKDGYSKNAEPCLLLQVYGLDSGNTQVVAEYCICAKDGTSFSRYYNGYIDCEMFLSDDASRLTVIATCLSAQNVTYTTVISLDVSNAQQPVEINRVYVSGNYLSSRKVNGNLLVITNFNVGYYGASNYGNPIDYGKKETYVPQCGSAISGDFISIDNIHLPSNCQEITYTVLAMFNEKTLAVNDCYAVFSYSDDVYVSQNYIVIMRNNGYSYNNEFAYGSELSAEQSSSKKSYLRVSVCEIVALEYADGFKKLGETGLDGSVKDRYSMDEYNGVLRVFTTVNHSRIYNRHDDSIYGPDSNSVNVSLYCVDLSQMKVIASKERFAPSGDEVKSARFDGDKAYACTARRNTDPVFYFDLSDLGNITYVDTGEIDGFSVNLIKFNDLLLGIGEGESRGTLKVEMYKESNDTQAENGVVSVGKYERDCNFSCEYKAHFVDAEHALIGLHIYDYKTDYITNDPNVNRNKYLLLYYSAEYQTLHQIYLEQFDSNSDYVRAFYDDNGVYVFGTNAFAFIDLNKITIPQ